MRKPPSDQSAKFLLFAFPAYWTLAVLAVVLLIWKTAPNDPDVIAVAAVTAVVLAAAVLLCKGHWWVSLPMMALGVYIALQDDQFVGHILRFYGIYFILHYAGCCWILLKDRKKSK